MYRAQELVTIYADLQSARVDDFRNEVQQVLVSVHNTTSKP